MDKMARFRILCKFLNKNINATRYFKGIGFENALGDFEIDEDLWHDNECFIVEFEELVNTLFDCDFFIVSLSEIKIEKFNKIETIR